MVFDETTRIQRFAPVGHGRLHAIIVILHFTQHQIDVEGQTIGPHIQVVEPASSGPQKLGADGDRRNARALQGLTRAKQLVKGVRHGNAVRFEYV